MVLQKIEHHSEKNVRYYSVIAFYEKSFRALVKGMSIDIPCEFPKKCDLLEGSKIVTKPVSFRFLVFGEINEQCLLPVREITRAGHAKKRRLGSGSLKFRLHTPKKIACEIPCDFENGWRRKR